MIECATHGLTRGENHNIHIQLLTICKNRRILRQRIQSYPRYCSPTTAESRNVFNLPRESHVKGVFFPIQQSKLHPYAAVVSLGVAKPQTPTGKTIQMGKTCKNILIFSLKIIGM
jgi:hypothetical protein